MTLPRLVLGFLLSLLLGAPAQAQLRAVPALTGHVVDEAGMLDAAQRQRLDAVLTEYEQQTGSQIAVLLVKSTEPEAIEQFSIRVTDAWKLGRKGIDDGVLLLVARDNPKALRRLRIEAGRGVQGVLTDAQSKRILQDVIAPYFRQNQFYEGLVAGVGAIKTLLSHEQFAPPAKRAEVDGNLLTEVAPGVLVLLLIGGVFFFTVMRGARRQRLSNGSWGSDTSGFVLGALMSELSRASRHGGGGSGGGFSGGGGGFDGGGASGDW